MHKRRLVFRYPLLMIGMIIIILFFSPFLLSWITKTALSVLNGGQVRANWLNTAEILGSYPRLQFQFSQDIEPEVVIASFYVEPEITGTWTWLEEDLAVWQPDASIPAGQSIHFGFQNPEASLDSNVGRLKPFEWQAFIRAPEIVFLKGVGNGKELFKISPENPEIEIQLTQTDGKIVDFTVSPDGEQILFSKSNERAGWDLWIMNRDGQAQTMILDCGVDRCSSADWNPLRDEIVFTIENSSNETTFTNGELPKPYVLNLITGTTMPLLNDPQKVGYDPTWSSRGQWITFWEGMDGGIVILHGTSKEVGFADSSSEDTGCWSPEERYYYYSDVKEEGLPIISIIYQVEILSGVRNYFTDSDLFDLGYNYYYPVCHPRGQGLLVVVQVDPNIPGRELWWVLPNGSYEVVFNDLSQIVTQFTWSPDGSKVLFLSDSLAGLSDGSKIGIWETESFSSQQLFSDYIFQAHWLP
jgi:Tol biopolymer transport system component